MSVTPSSPAAHRDYSDVLECIAAGASATAACKRFAVTPSTFFLACRANSDLDARYARAREARAEALAERIVALADSCTPENYNAVRVQIDTLKWIAARMFPKSYGDVDRQQHAPAGTQINIAALHLDAASASTDALRARLTHEQRALLPAPVVEDDDAQGGTQP